jgi:hypothetical protein
LRWLKSKNLNMQFTLQEEQDALVERCTKKLVFDMFRKLVSTK